MILLEDIIGSLLIFIGLFFMIVGSFGLLLLPDFFARTHAASKVDTVGIVVALIGISFLGQGWFEADKALLAAFLIMLTNPVSAHALAKAAYRAGHKPWTKDNPERASESKMKRAD
ncbi:MAG TPA: monovalent cation/H(+) antiporter subunit G [Oceanipulchritudo sp.]|nr:monovalent cation/H(+) antiporter subunit G [Oceanipulchritudo sp.]